MKRTGRLGRFPTTWLASALLLLGAAGCGQTTDHEPPTDSGATGACCAEDILSGRATEDSIYQLSAPWLDADGKSVQLVELRGQAVVLSLIFTRCSYACPRTLGDLKSIETALSPKVRAQTRFVLISMDSERETVADLAHFRAEQELDPERWTLLRGDSDAVRELAAVLGFKYRRSPGGDYSHSNQISVLSALGVVLHQQNGLGADHESTIAKIEAASEGGNQ